MIKFIHGKTYTTSFICDSDSILKGTCIKTTAKMVTFDMGCFGIRRVKIREYTTGVESCMPLGGYSMAPGFDADTFEVGGAA